ncbi:MAG: hypothetical protein ABI625_03190 [bacterium]
MSDVSRLILAAVALSTPVGGAHATPALRTRVDTLVSCAPSRPAVTPQDTVILRVFGDPPLGRGNTVKWSVSAGRIVGSGAAVRWILSDAGLGRFTARASVLRGQKVVGSCSAEVALTPPRNDMGGLLPAGVFLVTGAHEEQGYGAYTYLLLGAPAADAAHKARHRAAIARYLQVAQDIASYDAGVSRARLNVNYLPVDMQLKWSRDPALADSVLAHYQYATAQTLLSSLEGAHLGGPYLVTVPAPLSSTTPAAGKLIVHDLSRITSDALVPVWVDAFLAQSTQLRWSEPGAWTQFPLRLRTAIGAVALGIPQVKAAMKDWSGWLDSWSSVSKGGN